MGNCTPTKVNIDNEAAILQPNNKDVVEHSTTELTHTYKISYPTHNIYKLSEHYIKTRNTLIKDKIPCFICGTRNKCKVVHLYIQPSAQTVIDWKLFGTYASNCTNIQSGESLDQFDWAKVEAEPELFVESPLNMIVLCDTHYTGVGGLKRTPFTDWILDKFAIHDHTFINV